MSEAGSHYSPQQIRAAVYQNRPQVLNGFRRTLTELLSIARTYAPLQKYDVTLDAFSAVSQLLVGYLRLRDGDLVMPTSLDALLGSTDFLFDSVLTEALEALTSLHRGAIGREDVQLSQQIINAGEYLSLESIVTRTLSAPPGENPTTAFIRGYLFGWVRDGAVRGLDDITMAGARAQSNIGKALLRKQIYLTAQSTIDDIEKLAYMGIAQRKPHVTGAPVRGIAEMLWVAVSEPTAGSHTIQAALLALRRICEAELQFKTDRLDQSLRFALGPFLDPAEPTALSSIVGVAVEKLSAAMEEANWVKADQYRSAIRELNDDLWQHLVAIGSAAANTESFALFYINANIAEIAKQELWLYELLKKRPMTSESEDRESAQRAWRTANFAEELLRHLKWIVGGTYWRIFDALNPPLRTNLIWEFFQTLSFIGILALDAGAPTLAESAIDELKTMAIGCLEKPPGSFRSAAEVAVFMARIGIVARQIGNEQILNASLVSLREVNSRIFAKQEEMQPDAETYDAAVLNELRNLKEQLDRDNLFLDEEDVAFFTRVTAEDIDAFTALLSGEG